jgi:hypothetical protein
MAKVAQGPQLQSHGIVLALYPSTQPLFAIELQRGTSTSNLARLGLLRQEEAGAPVLYRDVVPPSTTRYYYRARHTYRGFNASNWTSIVSATPEFLGEGRIPLEAEGRRRVDTLRDTDAKLRSEVQQTDGARTLPVIKGWERGEVNGGWVGTSAGPASTSSWWDGPAVAFDTNYQSAPDVRLYAASDLTFNEPDGANWSSTTAFSSTTRQIVQLHAVDVNAAGFTPRARLFQPSSTYKNASVFFASTTLDAVGESVALDLTTNAPSYNDQYTGHYRADLDVTSTKNAGEYTITVEIDSNTTGGWIERNTKSYDLSLLEATGASFTNQTMVASFSGGSSTGDVRLKIKSFSVSGMSSGVCSYLVTATTGPPGGVTWQYTTGGGIYTEMCPSTDDKVQWVAISKEAST